MKARVMTILDMHKKAEDFSTIKGYTQANTQIQFDMINFMLENGVTHLNIAGDLYHNGYHDTGRTFNDRNLDEQLSKAVKGNAYICLGNHVFIERDSNPEMYLIQPSEIIQPSKPIYVFNQIYRTTKKLKIGTVQFSYCHYNKDNYYHIERDPDTTFHVAIFHTELIVPKSVRMQAGYDVVSPPNFISNLLKTVDLVIVGHVHKEIGLINVNVDGRKVPMYIPGSHGITDSSLSSRHKKVSVPIIDIEDDDSVKVWTHDFSTHLEMMQFSAERKESIVATRDAGNIESAVYTKSILRDMDNANVIQYLRAAGYEDDMIELVSRAEPGRLSYSVAREILK